MKLNANIQRAALLRHLERAFGEVQLESSGLPWLKVPGTDDNSKPLARIRKALEASRGHKHFITEDYGLRCDFVVPSERLIIEYDERQHFSNARAISLRHYPADKSFGFDIDHWAEQCRLIAAKDNDPIYRDEQRAYYDSVRDILAEANGFKLIRLQHGMVDWTAAGAFEKLVARWPAGITTSPSPCTRIVTVCIEGKPAKKYESNAKRLDLLGEILAEVNGRWAGLDAIVLPGGFFRLQASIGHLSHKGRVQSLNRSAFGQPIKGLLKIMSASPAVTLIAGVDGPPFDSDNGGDQLCVAWTRAGIVGIGRKIFPVAGDEAEALVCVDDDFCTPNRVIELANGRKVMLCACYDMYGVGDGALETSARAHTIRWIGSQDVQIGKDDPQFKGRLARNLDGFRNLIAAHKVTIAISTVHGFSSSNTAYWQKNGAATASARLDGGLALCAAHFKNLPRKPASSTLAARNVPESHLAEGTSRVGHAWLPTDSFLNAFPNGRALVRLFVE